MHKQKQKQQPKPKPKPQGNQYKALYQIAKQRKVHAASPEFKGVEKLRTQRSRCVEDSLDNAEVMNEERQCEKGNGDGGGNGNGVVIGVGNYKKGSHNRSQSCPFMNLPTGMLKTQPSYLKHPAPSRKNIIQNQSKRTLKKISTMHKKNNRLNHKYSIGHYSQLSQQSNTVIVHSLPIEHLSSMLYSFNHEKQRNFKKISPSSAQHHIFSIHGDLYFQTRLQQQIKMYDLSEEMRKLQRETENVKIKQEVLEKLANKVERDGGYTEEEDSLLIH